MRLDLSPEESRESDANQRELARQYAERLSAGETLKDHEAGFVALILQQWANRAAPKIDKRTEKRKFCHGTACREYAWRVARDKMHHTDAADTVAFDLNVTREAILNAVNAQRLEVDALIKTYSKK